MTSSIPAARPPRRHLGRRAFAVAFVVILLLSTFGYAALRANLQQNKDEAVNGVERTARLAGALGSSLIALVQQELGVLGRGQAFQQGDVAAIQQAVNDASPILLGFNAGFAWVDAGGVAQATFPPVGVDLEDLAVLDLASTEATKTALGGTSAIEGHLTDAYPTLPPLVFAVPTKDKDQHVNGALVGAVLLDSSSQNQLEQLFGTDSLLVLDDQTGEAVLGGNDLDAASIALAKQAREFVGKDANGVIEDIDGSVVGFSKVTSAKWLIVVERERDDLFAPLQWQFERSLFALALLFLVSVLGAAYAALRLDRVHGRETESRQLFQTVLEQLPVGVAAVDREGRLVVTNERADTALGGRPPRGEPAPDSLHVAVEAVRRRAVVRDLDVRVGEWSPHDDESRTLEVSAAPVEWGGHVTGAAAIVQDVTERRQRAERTARLAEATAGLALASSREEVAEVVAGGVRAFGAQAAMVVLRDQMNPDQLVLASTSGYHDDVTSGWATIPVDASTPVSEATRTGNHIFVELAEAEARFPDMGDLFANGGNEAWAALPLRSAGRIDGALGMSFRRAEDLDTVAQSQLAGFAAQVSQALDRASRQSIEHDVALVLQRGLLQPAGGDVVGIEFASRYVPAEDHLEVGGDFFDVIALEDDSCMLVIGDVVGHGLEAASAMGQLRSAVRAVSATTSSPARVLELLDRFASVVPACRFSTAAIVVVAADRRSITYSVAGHPAPAWHDATGAAGLLDGALSRPLGVYPADRPEATVEVGPAGLTVCLYTDGLIEKRDEIIDVGLEQLTRTMATHHGLPCEHLADRLLTEVGGPGVQRDDIAVLCARF